MQKQYEAQQTASERLWQMFSHFQASLDEDGSGRGGAGGAGREAGGAAYPRIEWELTEQQDGLQPLQNRLQIQAAMPDKLGTFVGHICHC